MPRPDFSTKLPDEIREELNQRIRKSNYTSPGEHAEWLQSLGYQASRSGLSRYGRTLMKIDGQPSIAREISARRASEYGHLTPHERILVQLGELKVREAELLKELAAITGGYGIELNVNDAETVPESDL